MLVSTGKLMFAPGRRGMCQSSSVVHPADMFGGGREELPDPSNSLWWLFDRSSSRPLLNLFVRHTSPWGHGRRPTTEAGRGMLYKQGHAQSF